MVQSKRLKKTTVSKTGVTVEKVYCRKCMESKLPKDFFVAVDSLLDSNGYFSICKDCCNKIYESYFRAEHNMAHAILQTCRKINLRFDEATVKSTEQHIKTLFDKGSNTDNVIGIYKSKLSANLKDGELMGGAIDYTFSEPTTNLPPSDPLTDSDIDSEGLKEKWGETFNYDDYMYLEKELSEWKKTHKADTKAEIILLKELCYKSLEIKKKREATNGSSPADLVKQLQELMKTASVDPAKTNSIGAGKSQDTFSAFIKTIEENEPADYFKDKELFKDFDNIGKYFQKYVTRPLKNFITQSRDFNVENEDEEEEEDFSLLDKLEDGE